MSRRVFFFRTQQKAVQTLQSGAVGGEFVVEHSEERQRVLQSCEGLDGLLDVADFDLSGKQARGLQNNGEEFDAVGEHIVKAAQADALSRNAPTVADNGFKAVGKLVMFVFFAAVKRHAFGVVAHADEGITIVAVELFVFIVVTNQRVAYPHGDKGRQNHKHIDKPNDAVRNVETEHGQDACQAPQNNGKFQRGNDRIDHAAHKFYG